jgi:hypothetical protein
MPTSCAFAFTQPYESLALGTKSRKAQNRTLYAHLNIYIVQALTRHAPGACSVIEEIVEGFVEGFCMGIHQTLIRLHDGSYWRSETGTDLKLRVTPHSEGMPDRLVWLQC